MHVRKLAGDLIRKAKSQGLLMEGKDPKGFAGAALYLSAKKHSISKTQIEIAFNAHITEVTLRMRARELDRFF
jgi:transcription initiation factor TFIIIB Brf1 subunit/transcription initiation factor TFIIB